MNALANSQRRELQKFLTIGYPEGPPVTFARYTGQESAEDRARIIANPPDILLTNYVMLELVLTRPRDRGLIEAARGLVVPGPGRAAYLPRPPGRRRGFPCPQAPGHLRRGGCSVHRHLGHDDHGGGRQRSAAGGR